MNINMLHIAIAEKSRMKDGGNRKRYFSYFKSHIASFVVVFCILLGATYCDSVTPSLYRKLMSSFSKGNVEMEIVNLSSQLLLYTLGSSVLFLAGTYLTNISGESISSALRMDLFESLQTMPFWFFTLNKTGHYISLFNHQLHGAHNGISNTIPKILTNVMTIGMASYQLLKSDWKIASGILLILPFFVLVTEYLQTRLRASHQESHDNRSKMNDSLKSSFSSAAILAQKNFGLTHVARNNFSATSHRIQTSQERIAFFKDVHMRFIYLLFALISSLAFILVAFYIKTLKESGMPQFEPGDFIQLITALNKLQGPLISLGTIRVELSNTFLCFEAIFQHMSDAEHYQEKLAKQLSGDNSRPKLKLSTWPGDVEVSNLNFVYPILSEIFTKIDSESFKKEGSMDTLPSQPDDKKMVLKNINLKIAQGSKVALVGPNGSGKTTLAFLLAGLHFPSSGSISVAAHTYSSIDDASLRNLVGILDQDPWFENDTILANFRLVSPDVDLSSVENACQEASILDFIKSLPNGFHTMIGENGMRLSSGQRQLLALARLILKNPSFIILDEFNAHLSSQTETLVFQSLMTHFADATIVIITHRLSILPKLDEIFYLSDGEVIEHGTHARLMQSSGPYATLQKEYESLMNF